MRRSGGIFDRVVMEGFLEEVIFERRPEWWRVGLAKIWWNKPNRQRYQEVQSPLDGEEKINLRWTAGESMARLFRALKSKVSNLDFILSENESPWKVLRKRVIRFEKICFDDCEENGLFRSRMEVWRPVGRLLQEYRWKGFIQFLFGYSQHWEILFWKAAHFIVEP